MTERLVRAYPDAVVTGIDITPNVGRLFCGDRGRVLFLRKSVQDSARDEPASFELVILCDVLHHVALLEREQFLAAIDHAMAPGVIWRSGTGRPR
jgi:2-polyprenyl-6-hydroxyphenyl methylase/3-demethylubiquinone-9 3-methyltransferase